MANDLTGNPLVIDTAGVAVLLTEDLFVATVRWDGATTAGHQAVIQDQAGAVKWASRAAGANHVEAERISPPPSAASTHSVPPWSGLKVPTLASGTLYITLYERPGRR